MLHRSFVLCLFTLVLACGAPDRDGYDGMGFEYEAEGGAAGEPGKSRCDEGDTKKCRIKIAEHEGVVTCVDGLRTCVDGDWTECEPFDG